MNGKYRVGKKCWTFFFDRPFWLGWREVESAKRTPHQSGAVCRNTVRCRISPKSTSRKSPAFRVFSRGSGGGDAVPPQILGGNASPPGGGRILTWEKKDMGGGWGSPAHTPIWDTTYVTRTRKKRGGRESSAREARLIPFLASL